MLPWRFSELGRVYPPFRDLMRVELLYWHVLYGRVEEDVGDSRQVIVDGSFHLLPVRCSLSLKGEEDKLERALVVGLV